MPFLLLLFTIGYNYYNITPHPPPRILTIRVLDLRNVSTTDNNIVNNYLPAECIGLKDLNINVPVAVPSGSTLQMNCTYDLENTALYSIKWYLRDQEFYRYVPKESPPTRVFPSPGIVVDVR